MRRYGELWELSCATLAFVREASLSALVLGMDDAKTLAPSDAGIPQVKTC